MFSFERFLLDNGAGKPMRLDDDLITSFKEFGAVLLPKVIPESWVEKLRKGIEFNMSTPG